MRTRITLSSAALAYAHKGIPVFPVHGKVPYAGTRGFHEASCHPERIRWWWNRWPNANVAIPTGQTSWIVLDIDGRHGGFASLARLKAMLEHRLLDLQQTDHIAFPVTLTSQTGSGLHLMFKPAPTQELRNTVEYAGFTGIDLRGEGGYVVVPPSLHPNGRRYQWHTLLPPVPFPPLLLHLVKYQQQLKVPGNYQQRQPSDDHTSPPASAQEWLMRAVQRARIGTRHSCALWLSCRLIEHGLDPQEAESYLRRYVEQVPGGGQDYPLSDAFKCLQWASTHVLPRR